MRFRPALTLTPNIPKYPGLTPFIVRLEIPYHALSIKGDGMVGAIVVVSEKRGLFPIIYS